MENLTRITVPTVFQMDTDLPPSPHFDDERTLLTARPVVPISDRVLGNRRDYVLTAAILLIAALLGAIGALSIDRFQKARQHQASAQNQAADTVPEPVANMSETEDQAAASVVTTALPDEPEATPTPSPETKVTTTEHTAVPVLAVVKTLPKKSSVREKVVSQRSPRAEPPREDSRGADAFRARRSRSAGRISEIFEGPGLF
ncbi:MAG: hypothetical protein QOD75_3653 [Blastocatellia bacterium]|jgi:cytoskeletal protein RodZ|nr:hypothetical protein [Blastocatellia bacterium]